MYFDWCAPSILVGVAVFGAIALAVFTLYLWWASTWDRPL